MLWNFHSELVISTYKQSAFTNNREKFAQWELLCTCLAWTIWSFMRFQELAPAMARRTVECSGANALSSKLRVCSEAIFLRYEVSLSGNNTLPWIWLENFLPLSWLLTYQCSLFSDFSASHVWNWSWNCISLPLNNHKYDVYDQLYTFQSHAKQGMVWVESKAFQLQLTPNFREEPSVHRLQDHLIASP